MVLSSLIVPQCVFVVSHHSLMHPCVIFHHHKYGPKPRHDVLQTKYPPSQPKSYEGHPINDIPQKKMLATLFKNALLTFKCILCFTFSFNNYIKKLNDLLN
jgi:hypothetical protein